MKLIWLTDIHLDFIDNDARKCFYQKLLETPGDRVIITGDISEAPSVSDRLREMASEINKPIYFVLGNHDYYRGQVDEVRKEMTALTKEEKSLHWLPAAGPQELGDDVVLLGTEAWADGRYGDYANSCVPFGDNQKIDDLYQSKILGKSHLLKKMQQLADNDASQLQINLANAISKHKPKKIIIIMHIPPFKEPCSYEGKVIGDDFLPFFVSKATGDILMQVARENMGIEFLVFCGHTHDKGYFKACDNLTVTIGAAEDGKPEIQEAIDL